MAETKKQREAREMLERLARSRRPVAPSPEEIEEDEPARAPPEKKASSLENHPLAKMLMVATQSGSKINEPGSKMKIEPDSTKMESGAKAVLDILQEALQPKTLRIEPGSNPINEPDSSENEPDSKINEPGSNPINEPDSSENEPESTIEPGSNKNEPDSKDINEPGSKAQLNPVQNPPATDARIHQLNMVKKNELAVILFLRTLAIPARDYETTQISRSQIEAATGVKKDSIKTCIARAVDKAILSRGESMPGVDGWTTYRFAKDAYLYFGKKNEPGSKVGNEPGSKTHSSSSYFNRDSNSPKTTTAKLSRVYEWAELIRIPATLRTILTVDHMRELEEIYQDAGVNEGKLEFMEKSLRGFALTLEAQGTKNWDKPPDSVFFGKLRKNTPWPVAEIVIASNEVANRLLEQDDDKLKRALELAIERKAKEEIEHREWLRLQKEDNTP